MGEVPTLPLSQVLSCQELTEILEKCASQFANRPIERIVTVDQKPAPKWGRKAGQMTEQDMKRNEWVREALAVAQRQEEALYQAWCVDSGHNVQCLSAEYSACLKTAWMAARKQVEDLRCLTAYSVRVVCANTFAMEHDSEGGAA